MRALRYLRLLPRLRPSWILLVLLMGGLVTGAAGQQTQAEVQREIRASQERLEQIRDERSRLQAEMNDLRLQVRNVSGELANIERQLSASRSVLGEIDFQVEALEERTEGTTVELLRSRERLREQEAVLQRRLRSIYMRGPLQTVRVLLGADSFVDLLNRYRYLQLMARHDRQLVADIRELEASLQGQNQELRSGLTELNRLRAQQVSELEALRRLEDEHQGMLDRYRSRERQAMTDLEQLEADEARLAGVMNSLEARRIELERQREAEGRADEIPARALTPADRGVLDWPVEGELLYSFGPERRPNGTVIRWNGVGIRAAAGTPVRAVRDGQVVLAGPFEGYGPTVIVSHGDGFYTLYLYLDDVGVVEGRPVRSGQVVGTVGGAGTPEGARLEFQVRVPGPDGAPRAEDPMEWLRGQR
ncbi:MAG: hypothetical protein EA352_04790 [Gemmatimonadales bacterium]|nr:MAG: hypothetical protein EA352_04790 [Gemmatimonadales bacterium]